MSRRSRCICSIYKMDSIGIFEMINTICHSIFSGLCFSYLSHISVEPDLGDAGSTSMGEPCRSSLFHTASPSCYVADYSSGSGTNTMLENATTTPRKILRLGQDCAMMSIAMCITRASRPETA